METNTKTKLSPRFFFLSLGVLISLITSVVAFLGLVFDTLNKKFPDALNSYYQYGYSSWSYDSIRSAIATLMIVFPVFLILAYFWRKETRKNLEGVNEIIRKWMVYLILFLAGVVVVVDLVTLVRYFVAGEITTRFIMKVLVTLIVAVLVGVYYLNEIGVWKKKVGNVLSLLCVIVAPALIVASVVWSFTVIGTPKEQRAWRLDQRRVEDLQSIQWQVIGFWQQKERLPESLNEVTTPLSGFAVPVDPEFEKGFSYAYRKTDDLKFELCATFSAGMPRGWQEYGGGGGGMPMFSGGRDIAVSYPYHGSINENWDHEIGEKCFEREIDKDIYPPFPKEVRG